MPIGHTDQNTRFAFLAHRLFDTFLSRPAHKNTRARALESSLTSLALEGILGWLIETRAMFPLPDPVQSLRPAPHKNVTHACASDPPFLPLLHSSAVLLPTVHSLQRERLVW